jgi:hypothetical protein
LVPIAVRSSAGVETASKGSKDESCLLMGLAAPDFGLRSSFGRARASEPEGSPEISAPSDWDAN